jgi:hypothetical protein
MSAHLFAENGVSRIIVPVLRWFAIGGFKTVTPMKYSKPRFKFWRATWVGFLLLSSAVLGKSADTDLVAVSARTSTDYKREKLPDGTFKPEMVTFGKGGLWAGAQADPSIDKMQFMDVVRAIAGPLAAQKYISSANPKETTLLIMVYWGKTNVPTSSSDSLEFQRASEASSRAETAKNTNIPEKGQRSQQDLADAAAMEDLESEARDKRDAENAAMLGYDEEWKNTEAIGVGALSFRRTELKEELEDRKYFVVLMAYDFQLLWKQKKRKLLWETRFNIRDRGREFDQAINQMAIKASKYFGEDTHGVIRREVPEGKIDFGEIKVVDEPKAK